MPTLNDFYQWSEEHNRLQNIKEYNNFTREFNSIKARVLSTRRLRNADDLALKNNIILHFRRIINDGSFRNMLEKNGYSNRAIGYIITVLSKDLDSLD